jgi:hypothetical protein
MLIEIKNGRKVLYEGNSPAFGSKRTKPLHKGDG